MLSLTERDVDAVVLRVDGTTSVLPIGVGFPACVESAEGIAVG